MCIHGWRALYRLMSIYSLVSFLISYLSCKSMVSLEVLLVSETEDVSFLACIAAVKNTHACVLIWYRWGRERKGKGGLFWRFSRIRTYGTVYGEGNIFGNSLIPRLGKWPDVNITAGGTVQVPGLWVSPIPDIQNNTIHVKLTELLTLTWRDAGMAKAQAKQMGW